MESIIHKHKQLLHELDCLFEKYKFNDLLEIKKSLEGNFENNKKKFEEQNNIKYFNYLYYCEIYIKILNTEKNFVMFSIRDNNMETNINKNQNNYIVCQNGYRWIKIITKNADVINNSLDPDYYENFCITTDIDRFISDCHNINFLPFGRKPELYVIFYEKPNGEICDMIFCKNIRVKTFFDLPLDEPKYISDFSDIEVLNIDVNVIITLCSELSNLEKCVSIPDEILKRCITGDSKTFNDIVENKNFILDTFAKFNKKIICKSAYDKLREFCNGVVSFCPKEVERIKNALDKYNITIVPDNMTERIKNMKHPNKLANVVFGSGDYYNAITITAYNSYINHAKQYRLFIPVIICKSVEFSEKFLNV
jgi:hypothetical protein